jgi:hypothetical protein
VKVNPVTVGGMLSCTVRDGESSYGESTSLNW